MAAPAAALAALDPDLAVRWAGRLLLLLLAVLLALVLLVLSLVGGLVGTWLAASAERLGLAGAAPRRPLGRPPSRLTSFL